jgi:hypothetical protein
MPAFLSRIRVPQEVTMIPLASWLRAFALALIAPLVVACVVESDPHDHRGPTTVAAAGGPTGSAGSGGGTSSSAPGDDGSPSASPILVDVDTNKTMNAAPGQGVGVFTEYTAGGHWHVWWTCDSSVNPQSVCPFDVKITAASGAITNVKTEKFEQTDSYNYGSALIEATTTTTTDLDGLLFDTDPGAVITLDATVAGKHDSRFLFFVQDGQVNGGFNGTLTDPIMLEGTKP